MSISAMNWVFEESGTKGSPYTVLIGLADMADENDECWPGMDRIAHRGRVSRETAKRAVKQLVDCGEVEIVSAGGGRKTNRYRLTRRSCEPGQIDPAPAAPVTPHPGHR